MKNRWIVACALFLVAADAPPSDLIKKANDASSHKAAAALYEAAYAASADAWVLLHAGEERRLNGETRIARAHFEEVAANYPTSSAKDAAKLGMAVIDAAGRAGGNTLATLQLYKGGTIPGTLDADRWLLIAGAARAEGQPEAARSALKKAVSAARNTREEKRVTRAADEARAALPVVDAPNRADANVPADQSAILRVRAALSDARFTEGKTAAEAFLVDFPDSPFRREADYAVQRADNRVVSDRHTIALLLPLTGDYAIPGGNLQAAVELGLGDHATLVVHDTAGKGDTCVAALEKAVLEEGAAAVIGPLTREESLPCAAAAQAMRVPMLTLTTSEDVVSAGDQIFRTSASTGQQIKALLDEVNGRRVMKRFAVLHPKNAFGENAAKGFAAEVAVRGGEIVIDIGYDPESKDFRSLGKELGRKDYKARSGEFYRVKQEIERAGGDPDKATLPPLIDFDAIFIPDGYQRAALIAAALGFEEFPVGSFRPKRDSTPLPLLGLNAWNNDEWPRRGGKFVIDSIFVDAFDARVQDPAVVRFVEAWHARGKGEPTVVEATGYDTARLLAVALQSDIADVASAIQAAELPDPVAGTLGVAPDRQARREWRVLTVRKDGIGPLDAPEIMPPAPE